MFNWHRNRDESRCLYVTSWGQVWECLCIMSCFTATSWVWQFILRRSKDSIHLFVNMYISTWFNFTREAQYYSAKCREIIVSKWKKVNLLWWMQKCSEGNNWRSSSWRIKFLLYTPWSLGWELANEADKCNNPIIW